MTITQQKYDALGAIIDNHEIERGLKDTRIEETITRLYQNGKITDRERTQLILDLASYQNYILKVLARSIKVRVMFNQPFDLTDKINPTIFDNNLALD